MFKCDQCGCCCRHLYESVVYAELDRGDGVCKYLIGNLCSIYEKRPMVCRVDEGYKLYFSAIMSREEYYRLNENECKRLKKEEKLKCQYQ